MKCAYAENAMRYQILYFSLNIYMDRHTGNYTSLWQSWMPSSGLAKKGIIFFKTLFDKKILPITKRYT
jgi:hypothetical protein